MCVRQTRGKWGWGEETERKAEQGEQDWRGEGKMGNRRGAQRQRETDGEEARVRVLSSGPQIISLLPGRARQGRTQFSCPV